MLSVFVWKITIGAWWLEVKILCMRLLKLNTTSTEFSTLWVIVHFILFHGTRYILWPFNENYCWFYGFLVLSRKQSLQTTKTIPIITIASLEPFKVWSGQAGVTAYPCLEMLDVHEDLMMQILLNTTIIVMMILETLLRMSISWKVTSTDTR